MERAQKLEAHVAKVRASGFPLFMPSDGFCNRCGADLLERVSPGNKYPVTGCWKCLMSFCE